MSHIERMFTESIERMREIMKGGFDKEKIMAAQKEFEGQVKMVNSVVQAYGIAAKYGKKMDVLEDMNIIERSARYIIGTDVEN